MQATIFAGETLDSIQSMPGGDTDTLLPDYNLLMLVDSVTEEEQIGAVMLVYTEEDDARTAAAQLSDQFASGGPSILERASERGLNAPVVEVVANAGERHVVVVSFGAPLPAGAALAASGPQRGGDASTSPGVGYQLLYQGFLMFDLPWLGTDQPQ
jgi:hypothetical protein